MKRIVENIVVGFGCLMLASAPLPAGCGLAARDPLESANKPR
jgi:hypothetical protein